MITTEVALSAALTGLGLVGLAYQFREWVYARASMRWPRFEADVIAARIEAHRGRRTTYHPAITYKYFFHGREYLSHRIAFGHLTLGSHDHAKQVIDRFAVGTRWEVSVCERRPTMAVLHPGPTARLHLALFFLISLTVGGASCLAEALTR